MPFIHLQTWLIVFCGLIPWLWIPTSQAAVDEEPPKPISMEVFLKIPKLNTYEFHIYLTNISGESLTIDLHTLPWLPPNDLDWLVAFRSGSGQRPLEATVSNWRIWIMEHSFASRRIYSRQDGTQ